MSSLPTTGSQASDATLSKPADTGRERQRVPPMAGDSGTDLRLPGGRRLAGGVRVAVLLMGPTVPKVTEARMIVVRDIFRVRFGKAREALALWKQGLELNRKCGYQARSLRVLTDLVGEYYTLVFESTFDSLSDWEKAGKSITASPEWRAWYDKIVETTDTGRREIFTIAAEG